AAMVAFTSGAKTGVGVDAAKMSRVAVYSGKAEVSASGKQVQVHRGFGTRVEQGKAPEPPTPLPEAPQWSTDTVLLAWSFANRPAAPQLAWKETARAAVYRVQVARDAGFYDRAIDTAVKAGEPLQIAKALPVGALFARVRAVDAKGLPGPASETLRVLVVSVRASAEVPAIGELALRATGQLTLTIEGPQGVQLAVGKGAAQDLPQGELSVRDVGATEVVVSAQGAKPLRLPIAIDAPSAAVQIAPAAGDSLQHAVSIELRDAAGEPFTSQAITARTSDGHALPLTFDGATARTMLQEPAEGSTRVEALWGERVIGSAEVAARMKSPPPPPAPVLPPGKHAGVLGGTNATGAATPLPTAFIDPGLSVALRLQPELGATAQRNQVFAGGLDVEGGTDRYTFSLGLNAQSAPALTDSGAKVWPALGVRDAIFTQDQVSLVLGGDVSFGLGSSADGLRLPLLRLYLALGIELGPLSLSTTQALAPSDSGSGTGWDGSVVGAWHAKPWLDVIAEVGGASGGTCPIDCTAFAAGAGVRGRHGAFEAGASLRTGLYPAGREFWGAPALVFTLGWRGFDAWGKQPPAPQ
ncbi:MAG: hypothetical protein JST92_17765, partial [Deltaproteobacteria bacterium]|nr:hypothetical protein [Deltaproteobacteria bacterium]